MPRLNKHLKKLHESHDVTSFLILIMKTLLIEDGIEIQENIMLFNDCFTLRSLFIAIETLIFISIGETDDLTERCHLILN